jgi:hypothetical protein
MLRPACMLRPKTILQVVGSMPTQGSLGIQEGRVEGINSPTSVLEDRLFTRLLTKHSVLLTKLCLRTVFTKQCLRNC